MSEQSRPGSEMPAFTQMLNLAAPRIGANVEAVSDDYFAPVENLLKASTPVFEKGLYTDHGQLMDGWESRRRRTEGHDWCIIRLGVPGRVHGLVVDTTHFTGNYPESCRVEACALEGYPDPELLTADSNAWHELLPQSDLLGDSPNYFPVTLPYRVTHLRLHVYPDGGVARLRVHGAPIPRLHHIAASGAHIDLASAAYGASVVSCSDMFYSSRQNLIMPSDPKNMGDGWETKRRRDDGHDWAIIRLVGSGWIRKAIVDTRHFKGNAPASVMIEGMRTALPITEESLESAVDMEWRTILPRTALRPNTEHVFIQEIAEHAQLSVVRVHIYPDGGLARLRLFGEMTPGEQQRLGTRWLNALPDNDARQELLQCCASTEWADRLVDARPFASPEALFRVAREIWESLEEDDWREAFDAHPRIGEFAAGESTHARWSSDEQAGTANATEATLSTLRDANDNYEERFGFVFLICATGQTADGMLAALGKRISNDQSHEVRIAAAEQAKITELRLRKLLRP